MKADTFFKNFDTFADAPNAIAKVRELIFTLAVQGRLASQEPNDEPAIKLLKRIEQSKRNTANGSKVRSVNNGDNTLHAIYPFKIPPSWIWTELKNLGHTSTGKTPSTSNAEFFIGEIPFIGPGQVRPSGEIIQAEKLVSELGLLSSTEARPNDILMVCIGGSIGKAAIVRQRLAFNQQLNLISPIEIKTEYLFSALRTKYFYDQVILNSSGSATPIINRSKWEAILVPLPPLAEQKRIVAKVDELMALCDRLEAQQQERANRHTALSRAALARFADAPTPTNLQYLFHPAYTTSPADLRKSILTLAVQGKLVPQDPNDEDVNSSLIKNDLKRSEIAKRDHRADESNQTLLSADDCWELPDSWIWRGLADLALFVDYRGKTPVKIKSGVRLLTAKNVRKGYINLSPEEFLSMKDYQEWMTRGFPKSGDVLITTEAPMGNAAVIMLTEKFALAQRVICFQLYGAIDPAFLVMQILSDKFQFILDKNGTGMTAKGIKASKLKMLPIAVPPLAEQRRIVAKVDQLMTLVDQLETHLATAHTTAINLMEALVLCPYDKTG